MRSPAPIYCSVLVRPDPAELDADLLDSWNQAHRLTDGHPHVHGANLGISAEMYARSGGFADVAAHEDVLLATRVRELGVGWSVPRAARC